MQSSKTRIYDTLTDINSETVKSFWEKRLNASGGGNKMNTVLLGNQNDTGAGNMRNEREKNILKSFLPKQASLSILDIGCGIGRWADNFKDIANPYHGLDFSENFITADKQKFKDLSNLEFFPMSAVNIDKTVLLPHYNLVIITGVLMYINDNELKNVFETINSFNPQYIYIQESVCLLNERLTLKNFYSEELKTDYSAIYRTSEEYETQIRQYFEKYIAEETGLLLDENTGAREETNARYWFLNRGENNDRK